ncbi:MAG: hypothetical protein KGZ69_03770 [Methylomonas sp.]|nr:hypothetical protein [Methylomonas sp.]
MLETIFASLISGGATGLIVVATMKADIRWLKHILAEHAERLSFIERNI